jgi:hypothetical protein
VSPKSHLLISISEDPPSVYLQNLTYSSAPRLLGPQVSSTAAVCASFHPTRPNVFLLGFKDGSLGIYDATKIIRSKHGVSEFLSGNAELKAFPRLHRVFSTAALRASPSRTTSSTNKIHKPIGISSSITDACFIPGTRSRVITAGQDGKCNIVDFEKGSVVKSWHAKGPITTMSVLHISEPAVEPTGTKKLRKPNNAASHGLRTIIAVGRVDGKVLLFDDHGTPLAEKVVDAQAGRVIDVEWIKGSSPEVVVEKHEFTGSEGKSMADLLPKISVTPGTSKVQPTSSRTTPISPNQTHARECPSPPNMLETGGKPFAPPKPMHSKFKEHLSGSHNDGKATLSTVRHIEPLRPRQLDLPKSGTAYMDLFSPVKQQQPAAVRASPPRHRPRITSITYNTPQKQETERTVEIAVLPKPVISPKPMLIPRRPVSLPQPTGTPAKVTSNNRLGSVSNISSGLLVSQRSLQPSSTSSRSSSNSKILAELQRLDKLNKNTKMRKTGGNLAMFAPDYTFQAKQSERSLGDMDEEEAKAVFSFLHSPKRRKSRGTSSGGSLKRASIGRVKVQRPTKIKARPRVPKQEAEHILLSDSGTEEPMSPRPKISNNNGSGDLPGDAPSQTSSSAPTYDPEAQPRSSFSSDSSLIEDSQATISPVRVVPVFCTAASAPQLTRKILEDASSSQTPGYSITPTTSSTMMSLQPMISPEPALPPGFAQSFEGPVDVAAYLPRRNSLNFSTPGRTPTKGREPMSEVPTTNSRRNAPTNTVSPTRMSKQTGKHTKFTCSGCGDLRDEIGSLRKRQTELEEEVAYLRRLMKGKAPAGK